MNLGDQQTELIIIGANPSGLMLAAQLLNFGVHPLIIDSKSSASKVSSVVSLQPRALEIFNQLGFEDDLLKTGSKFEEQLINKGKDFLGSVSYANFNTEFPFTLKVPQNKVEEILIKYLAVHACPIYWDTTVLRLRKEGGNTNLTLKKGSDVINFTCKRILIAEESQYHPEFIDCNDCNDDIQILIDQGKSSILMSPVDHAVNIGIQGAHNLGWKLAYLCLGKLEESILATYQEENQPIANYQVNYRLLKLLLDLRFFKSSFRDVLIEKLLKKIAFSEFNSHYRNYKLSFHHSLGTKIKAGDLLPFLPVYDEKKKEDTDLHEWCRKPGFVLILLGTINRHSLFIMAQWMKQKYTRHMHLFYLPFSEKNNRVFEAFEIKADQNKMVLVRPDMRIAYMHDVIGANLIDTYMAEVMKWRF